MGGDFWMWTEGRFWQCSSPQWLYFIALENGPKFNFTGINFNKANWQPGQWLTGDCILQQTSAAIYSISRRELYLTTGDCILQCHCIVILGTISHYWTVSYKKGLYLTNSDCLVYGDGILQIPQICHLFNTDKIFGFQILRPKTKNETPKIPIISTFCIFLAFYLEKFPAGRKFLHRHRLWRLWQIWGKMILSSYNKRA